MPETNGSSGGAASAHSNSPRRDKAEANGEAAVALLGDYRYDVPPIVVTQKNGTGDVEAPNG